MEPILAINLILLWGIVLLLTTTMLVTVRRLRSALQILTAQRSPEIESIPKLTVGEAAPDFTAFNHSGRQVTLSNYLGNNIVFIFISPHCDPCRNELPELLKIYPLLKSSGIDIVLVTMSTPSDMEPLVKEYNISIPILYSPPQVTSLTDIYDPGHVYPFYCFVDAQGTIISTDLIGGTEWWMLVQRWKITSEHSSHL